MESHLHNIELGFSDLISVYLETIDHLNFKFSMFCRAYSQFYYRVPKSSGNHGKPGKSPKKFHAWKNHGI